MSKHRDKIRGGYADDRQPKDFNKEQIKKGIGVEHEHTNDSSIAQEISMDHLEEIPDYYDRLDDMEEKAKKEKQLRPVAESFEDKLSRAFGIMEAYCPACGGQDVEQQGKGHLEGCPIGEKGGEIRGAGDAVRRYSKDLFGSMSELMSTFGRAIENARDPEYWDNQGVADSNTMQRELGKMYEVFSMLRMNKERERLRGIYDSISLIHKQATEQQDYVLARNNIQQAKEDLEGLRHRIQILMEI